jgi:ribosomal-protein-alanine N-acetyltransferase
MALVRSLPRLTAAPNIEGKRVRLRYPLAGDYEAWAELRETSRAFLTPWEPTWPFDDLTRAAFRRRVRRYQREVREDRAYAFFVFASDTDELVGGCTLSNIRRGVSQCCSLGYWVGERHARKGYLGDAVSALVPFVFETLGMHRLEAACLPSNEPSKHLLARCGFAQEGIARRFLRINGSWRDHLLFAILDDDPRPR